LTEVETLAAYAAYLEAALREQFRREYFSEEQARHRMSMRGRKDATIETDEQFADRRLTQIISEYTDAP
jgi:hypothetical protein